MMIFKNIFPFVIVMMITLFTSCEKDITVDLPKAEPKLVVEGYITPGQPAYLFISRTTSYFAPTDSASLIASAVKGATVTINNGIITDTLVEPFPGIGYVYVSPQIIGQVGGVYQLKVTTPEGESVTSITTIHPPVPLDSVWFVAQPELDTLGWIWATLTDPPQPGNYYRWFAKRLSKDDDFIAPLGSVLHDEFFNGLTFDFAYNRGEKPNSNEEDDNNDEAGWFKKGDTVVVKFAAVTRQSFEFWRAAESQTAGNGNPFGSPAPLESNIDGGFGIWEGFSFTLDTVVAQ
jgi:Domain of unknown function (DUF4249)